MSLKKKVKRLKGEGFTVREIARKLNKSYASVYYHFRNNYSASRSEDKRQKRFAAKQFVTRYKEKRSCKCGERDPVVLQFHHLDPSKKEAKISRMVGSGAPKEALLKEMEKCEVICANCHLRLHYKERNEDS